MEKIKEYLRYNLDSFSDIKEDAVIIYEDEFMTSDKSDMIFFGAIGVYIVLVSLIIYAAIALNSMIFILLIVPLLAVGGGPLKVILSIDRALAIKRVNQKSIENGTYLKIDDTVYPVFPSVYLKLKEFNDLLVEEGIDDHNIINEIDLKDIFSEHRSDYLNRKGKTKVKDIHSFETSIKDGIKIIY